MRGIPAPITRRRVVTGVIVLATGGVATVAVAAGPVVYSEYTTGGSRENRVVQGDGTGDRPFGGKDLTGAAVSPDGLRIAQTSLDTHGNESDLDAYTSELRVSAADGSGQRTVASAAAKDGPGGPALLTGTPVWSPDSRRVIIGRLGFSEDGDRGYHRRICEVDTGTCSDGGAVRLSDDDDSDRQTRGDVVTWQAADGPVVYDPARGGSTDALVRCRSGAGTSKGPTTTLHGLPGSSFGPPLTVRGLTGGRSAGRQDLGLAPGSASAVATGDGTLVADAPAASVRIGRLRCDRYAGEANGRASLGLPRLRLRSGGRTTTLPTPPGLRRGDGLRLVGTDGGGAVLVTVSAPGGSIRRYCFPTRKRGFRSCEGAYDASSYLDDRATVLRVWRYRPGASPGFERVTTARRSALKTLAGADEIATASGDALLAVTDDAIVRVPLDGGAPTTLASGRELSLELSGD